METDYPKISSAKHPYEAMLSLFGSNLGPFIFEQEVKLMEKMITK